MAQLRTHGAAHPLRPLLGLLLLAALVPGEAAGQLRIRFDSADPQLHFAVGRLTEAFAARGIALTAAGATAAAGDAEIHVVATPEAAAEAMERFRLPAGPAIEPEGFRLARPAAGGPELVVLAHDPNGAMYGTLDLAEQLRMRGGLDAVKERTVNPRLGLRAIKFNLPWSAYRDAPPTDLHLDAARDLEFWRGFLDMMAENRFNALTLWNLHPFPYMVRSAGFPRATPLGEEELAEWRTFWKSLFRMAKERGIETYLVNWNIVVSPEFAAAYGVEERNDTSELVRRYTREAVTQVIDEYEDLTGLGVTLADWMNDMSPREREDWIEDTFVAGMKDASRPVKFIHRSVLAGSPAEMRRVIDAADLPDPVWVEIKFNWSHGHSTPRLAMTHDHESGAIDEGFWNPPPTNYRIAWMIRNEDFFILRWGEPDFIRGHIATNDLDYVDGYFIGSEGFIPAVDYSHRPGGHRDWDYAFEKQWLFYLLWGRLLYDPDTPDEVFAAAFDARYGEGIGTPLLTAYRLASRMPLRLASFHAATWDYTLYSEGFLAPARSRGLSDGVSPFISILEMIEHETLDPTYLSIPDFVTARLAGERVAEGRVSPLALADSSERDGRAALVTLEGLRARAREAASPTLDCETQDVAAWGYLGLYLGEKLRAGVALESFRRTGDEAERERALDHLETALLLWDGLIAVTVDHYHPVPHVFAEHAPMEGGLAGGFSWAGLRDQVVRDLELARTLSLPPR
ncbi:MAG TPA: hypothetical protein VFZ18_03840 [Longimicrobiaceae bacterium]